MESLGASVFLSVKWVHSSYALLHKLSGIQQQSFNYAPGVCGAGIKKWYRGDCLSLLHNVQGLNWENLHSGELE